MKCPCHHTMLGVCDLCATSLVMLPFLPWLRECLPSFSTIKLLFSLSVFYSSFWNEAVSVAHPEDGEGQELVFTSWGVARSIHIHYLELFWKEDLSLFGIYLFIHSFIYINKYSCMFILHLGKILRYLFFLFKLFECWPLGAALGLLLYLFDLAHHFFF